MLQSTGLPRKTGIIPREVSCTLRRYFVAGVRDTRMQEIGVSVYSLDRGNEEKQKLGRSTWMDAVLVNKVNEEQHFVTLALQQ